MSVSLRKRFMALAVGATGVVYGDIGTSPLYTIKQVFGAQGIAVSQVNVLGVLSLIFWSLILVVSIKYLLFVMRADNKGEGGIVALLALAQRSARGKPRLIAVVAVLGIFGAALFYGDGVITPAISVLSAVEGLKVATPGLAHWVVPITLVVIVSLFALQKHGTGRIGALFGPICMVWFVCLAALGIHGVVQDPLVLRALDPWYGVEFFVRNRIEAFLGLGAVVLAVTGTEALYADMGHFGKQPIQAAWFVLVLPALVLNYFGQGALVLLHPQVVSNPFYHLVPQSLLYPMVALATMATVIASQAVISGAFSMTREAMQLGYVPRMQVVHTSRNMSGQVYMPWINRMLMVLVLAAVLGFRSSDNLGAAYGIAVTGTMGITTLLALVVARLQWRWNGLWIVLAGTGLLAVDLSFLGANAVKIASGGWFPLVLGLGVFAIMTTWRRGRRLVAMKLRQGGMALEPFLQSMAEHPPRSVPGTAIFMTADAGQVPNSMLHNLKHNKVLHERNVLLTVSTLDTPVAEPEERVTLQDLGNGMFRLELAYGFGEEPDVPATLLQCGSVGADFDLMDTTFFLSRERVESGENAHGMAPWRGALFGFLSRNAMPATAFFRIPGNRLIELGARVEI